MVSMVTVEASDTAEWYQPLCLHLFLFFLFSYSLDKTSCVCAIKSETTIIPDEEEFFVLTVLEDTQIGKLNSEPIS